MIWCPGPLPLPEQKIWYISPFIPLKTRCIEFALDIENFPTENNSFDIVHFLVLLWLRLFGMHIRSKLPVSLKINIVLWLWLYHLVSTKWKTRCSLAKPGTSTAGHGWRISYFARTLYIFEGLTHFHLSAKSQNISFDKKKNGMVWLYYADFDKKPTYVYEPINGCDK